MVESATGSIASIQQTTDTKSTQARKSLADNFDTFLTLLTTQLKNQDPSNPLDSNQFTQQLVSFTGVEQAIDTNKNLEKLIAMTQSTQINDAVSYLGKIVQASGNVGSLDNGEAHFHYHLDDSATVTTIAIKNLAGKTLYTITGDTEAGDHEFVWDGVDLAGNQLKDGKYQISVNAVNGAGAAVGVTTSVEDVVSSVTMKDGKPVLSLGDGDGGDISIDQVLSVRFRDFL